MKCNGCGVVLDPSEEQVNSAVDQILNTSVADARRGGGVCPLCGHSHAVPWWNHRTLLLAMTLILLLGLAVVALQLDLRKMSDRSAVVKLVIARMQGNDEVLRLLGMPMTVEGVRGNVTQDETGWKEANLTLHVRGPRMKRKYM